MPWRGAWQPTPVFLPGEFHGQRSLAGYSPWGHKEWDTTKPLTTAQHSTAQHSTAQHTLHKAIAAIDSSSSEGSETFWKRFTILDATKIIHDSQEEVRIWTLTGVWKKLIPALMDDLKGFKTALEGVAADVVGTA